LDKFETLRHYFGHASFRPGQEPLIDGLLSGQDVLGIMPTGSGKSMCYQVPALMRNGITLVISPLISLMKDQVAALKEAGIPAAYLNSSLTAGQISLAMQRASAGAYRIIYVAPERLETPSFLRFSQSAPIALIAVDEAHCVSQWGQDFRPNYLHIADFVDSLPRRPVVCAFTATATDRVKQDILRLLKLRSPYTATTGFDRPNLYFEVCQPKSKIEGLCTILRRKAGESGIVYCATRRSVEEVTERLIMEGINATRYHAGLSEQERKQNQEDFQYDRVAVMVATNAFGMGIDKSNVSFVIHFNMPRSMEAYYQEAGRAGRDGSDAECILLYSGSDIITGRWMIEHSDPNPELTGEEQNRIRSQDLRRLNDMASWCTRSPCLRAGILRYFGQKAQNSCGNCSRCVNSRYPEVNGLTRTKRTADSTRDTPTLPKAGQSLVRIKPASGDSLFERLRAVRMELAKANKCPPFVIASDKTLTDLAMKKPTTPEAMRSVYGMGDIKISRFGNDFLQVIGEWVKKGNAPQAAPKAQVETEQFSSDLLRLAYLSGGSIPDLAKQFHTTEKMIRYRLKQMHLILDTSSVERYGFSAWNNETDDDDA